MQDSATALRARFATTAASKPNTVEEAIEQLRGETKAAARWSDPDVTRRGLNVRKQGKRLSYYFTARNPDSKVVNIFLGTVGVMKPDEARARAQTMRRQIADGQCPRLEHDEAKRNQHAARNAQREARAWTVRKAIESKMADPSLRPGSRKNYKSLLNVALKDLADRRLDRISRADWRRLLEKVKRKTSAAQADKVKRMASALYTHAVESSDDLTLVNTVTGVVVKLDDGSGERRQGRIKEEDLLGWIERLDTLGNVTVTALAKLTLMGAFREAEARLLRWSEIEGDEIIIPAARYKTKREHRLPITNAMWRVLERQKGKSALWVFPSTQNRQKPISSILPQMKQLGYTVHDLRRTALSIIDSMGVPVGVRRAIGGHAPPSVAEGYVIVSQQDVRDALTRYHERLDDSISAEAYFRSHPEEQGEQSKDDGPPRYVWA